MSKLSDEELAWEYEHRHLGPDAKLRKHIDAMQSDLAASERERDRFMTYSAELRIDRDRLAAENACLREALSSALAGADDSSEWHGGGGAERWEAKYGDLLAAEALAPVAARRGLDRT